MSNVVTHRFCYGDDCRRLRPLAAYSGNMAKSGKVSDTDKRRRPACRRQSRDAFASTAGGSRVILAVLLMHVPLDAQRLLGFACGLHGHMRASRAHVAVKTAMEKEQTRERERYTRTIASGPRQDAEKSFYQTLYIK